MSRFFSERLFSLHEYVPGEQPQGRTYIKLNTNESPYPPSPRVLDIVNSTQASKLNLYPDPDCRELTAALAKSLGVEKENVVFGNGSDEILSYIFMAFCDSKHPMVFPDITYGFYIVFAQLYGVPYEIMPLCDDFSVNYKDYTGVNKNIIIANPNAPTGISLPLCEIEEILRTNPDNIVVIDEAYVDFGGTSCIPLINKYENLLVVQTYSKSRSMAGARLGFAVGSRELISDLNKIRFSTNPYNINRITLAAGKCAVEEADYYVSRCREIIATRENLRKKLTECGCTVLPSDANFLFVKHPRLGGQAVYEALRERGILVRHFNKERIENWLRITVGTPPQCEALINTIREL